MFECTSRSRRFMSGSLLSVLMRRDIEIAQAARPRPIVDVAADLGLALPDLVLRGEHVAKVRLPPVERSRKARQGQIVLVTPCTPTPDGEGKTGPTPRP